VLRWPTHFPMRESISTLPVPLQSDLQQILYIGYAVLIAQTWFFWSFSTDTWHALGKMILYKRRSQQFLLPYRLCFIQGVLGQIVTGLILLDQAHSLARCDIAMGSALVLTFMGTACINGILLFKLLTVAWYRRIIALFCVLESARLGTLLYTFKTTTLQRTSQGRCFVYQLSEEATFFTAAANCAENIVLSGLFVWSLYRYVQLVPSSFLRAALRDGAVYGLAILATSSLAAVVNALQLLGPLSDMVYMVEWTLASKLISTQLRRRGFSRDSTVDDDDVSVVME